MSNDAIGEFIQLQHFYKPVIACLVFYMCAFYIFPVMCRKGQMPTYSLGAVSVHEVTILLLILHINGWYRT